MIFSKKNLVTSIKNPCIAYVKWKLFFQKSCTILSAFVTNSFTEFGPLRWVSALIFIWVTKLVDNLKMGWDLNDILATGL